AVGAIVEAVLVFLIVGNVVAYSLHTMENVERVWHRELDWFEAASVAIFTLEYALRLWAATEDPSYAASGAFRGRLRAALHPMMVIDFFAIAPALVALFVPFFDLRILRLVRLFRLLKIARYSPAL